MTAAIFFFSLFAAISNYSTWVVYRDTNEYYYNGNKNGWWTLFWFAVMAYCAYRLDIA